MDESNENIATVAKSESDAPQLPPATAEQLRRAVVLLDLADKTTGGDAQFIQRVGALHLARSIPEYWFTVAEQIPIDLKVKGKERDDMKQRLLKEFEAIFKSARRYDLLTTLRQWDYHWEPMINPLTIGVNCTYGRGAPVRLSTGPGKGSATFLPSHPPEDQLHTTGSGRRVGRANYYRIHQNRYVDFETGEAVPLGIAIRQFIEDMPRCVATVLAKPEVSRYLKAQE